MGDVTKDKDTGPLPKFVPKENGTLEVQVDSEDCLRFIFGTASNELADGLLRQCFNAVRGANTAEQEFMVAAVKEISPRDGLEGMLATQMAAVHVAIMTFARKLAHVETIQQQDSAEKALNKLARTFTAQVEALKRYRTGGEQKVTVQHVNVSDGGQAIVGNVAHRGRGGTRNVR
jgi:hypothetical protein